MKFEYIQNFHLAKNQNHAYTDCDKVKRKEHENN